VALIGERQSPVERLFKTARKRRHFHFSSFVLDAISQNHFFSMMHCKGCWCLRG
jgi:hypothetical protein